MVPSRGDAIAVTVAAATPVVSALGPFPDGLFLDRIRVLIYLNNQAGTTGLRLGFGIAGSADETFEGYQRSNKVWRPRGASGAWPLWHRFGLLTGQSLNFEVDVGVEIQSGSRYVLVYHDLEDGTDYHELFVSVRTRSLVREKVQGPGV